MTTSRPAKKSTATKKPLELDPPKGREAATERILEAAEALFAEMSPAAVTTRAIAEKAQVNLALIHRYVGSKETVFKAVVQRYAQRFKEDVDKADTFQHGLIGMLSDPKQEKFFRTLAQVVLSGYPVEEALSPEGGIRVLVKSTSGTTTQVNRLLSVVAMNVGWLLFGEFLLLAAGSKQTPAAVRKDVIALMREITGD
jgi:AcrR family transcriptional regulator